MAWRHVWSVSLSIMRDMGVSWAWRARASRDGTARARRCERRSAQNPPRHRLEPRDEGRVAFVGGGEDGVIERAVAAMRAGGAAGAQQRGKAADHAAPLVGIGPQRGDDVG